MEHGFYHPDRGYWQTIDTPSQAVLDGYPQGTVEITLRPGIYDQWDGTQWVAGSMPTAELAALKRFERDALIDAIQWRIQRSSDEAALGLTPSEDRTALLTYVQALRDVPEQPGFPNNVTWPVDPANG